MVRTLRRTAIFALALLAAPACDRHAPGTDQQADAPTSRAGIGPTGTYDRHLVFLGPGDPLPTAGVFEFPILSDSSGVSRGAMVRVLDGAEWRPALDQAWVMAPMRDPWRLVPHGPLRVVVGDAGDLAALEVRDDELPVRLQPGVLIGEREPDATTRLVLRRATLALDGAEVGGVLLDTQVGRRLERDPAAADRTTERTPAGPEAMVMDNEGLYVVVAPTADGSVAWIRSDEQDELRARVRLEPTATEGGPDAFEPTVWRLVVETGALVGELRTEAADHSARSSGPRPTLLGYDLVSGWLENQGVRREVYGLVRHGR